MPSSRAPDDARAALETIREVGGEELVVALLGTFIAHADSQLADAKRAASADAGATVGRIAHSLKSSATQVGAHALAAACAAAERAGGGTDSVATTAFVDAIAQEYARVREWMQGYLAPG